MMTYKQNLHTHTTYCDGKDTPEEVVKEAIRQGFDSIGFSEHSYMSYSLSYGMLTENTPNYIAEINRLKKEYSDKIKIFCGIEFDMYSGIDLSAFDYAIGSFHYFCFGDEYVGLDRSAEEVEQVINTYFDGDGMKFAKKYYEDIAKLPDYGKFDIIGHYDLVAKQIDNKKFFDENSKEYISYAIESAESLVKKIPLFEVNTGAIARGYRKAPYPSTSILKELCRIGFGAVITSDCHDAKMLACEFDSAAEILKHCGFKEKFVLTDDGFVPAAL